MGKTSNGLILFTRRALGLSQAEFGRWLAEQLGRDRPIPYQRVAEWERGARSPRRGVRRVCAPVAADAIATDAVREAGRLCGRDLAGQPLTPDLASLRDDIKEAIEDMIA